ncbi:MAG: hypothetical protein FJ086_03235 [Deltaproteobacteria bacterium]|nr:hypothetical protein [Deltaproteobacteria bacterium]
MTTPYLRKAPLVACLMSGPVFVLGLPAGAYAGLYAGNLLDQVLGYPLGRESGFLGFGFLPVITVPMGALLGACLPCWAVLRLGGGIRGPGPLLGPPCGALVGAGACKLMDLRDPLSYGISASIVAGLGAVAVDLLRRT